MPPPRGTVMVASTHQTGNSQNPSGRCAKFRVLALATIGLQHSVEHYVLLHYRFLTFTHLLFWKQTSLDTCNISHFKKKITGRNDLDIMLSRNLFTCYSRNKMCVYLNICHKDVLYNFTYYLPPYYVKVISQPFYLRIPFG